MTENCGVSSLTLAAATGLSRDRRGRSNGALKSERASKGEQKAKQRRVKGKAKGNKGQYRENVRQSKGEKLTLTVGTSMGPLATVMKKGRSSWLAGLYSGK